MNIVPHLLVMALCQFVTRASATTVPCPNFAPYIPQPAAPPLNKTSHGQCSCGMDQCNQVTPLFNWIFTLCSNETKCNDNGCACQRTNYKNSSYLRLNYMASFQLTQVKEGWKWVLKPELSLNLRENNSVYYANEPLIYDQHSGRNDFANLPTETTIFKNDPPVNERIVNSISGGGGGWDISLFPYNTTALQPPGMLFVFSGSMVNGAWFALNKATLDRGPGASTCSYQKTDGTWVPSDNCWAKGSAGEIDFLESPNLFGGTKVDDPTQFGKLFATGYNGGGKCFPTNHLQGTHCHPEGYCGVNPSITGSSLANASYYTTQWFNAAGGPYSLFSYNSADTDDHIWAGVLDMRGVTTYRDAPWLGISSMKVDAELTALSPDMTKTAFTTGACGDPVVYSSLELSLPCVVYFPGNPVNPTKEQFDAATQLLNATGVKREDVLYRYNYPGVDTVRPSELCESDIWWNLMMDTTQVYVPPSAYGMTYTSYIKNQTVQLIVPGISPALEGWSAIPKFEAVIRRVDGSAQSAVNGDLHPTCLPGTTAKFLNCPFQGQVDWVHSYLLYTPAGMNIHMCQDSFGCCESCNSTEYLAVLESNICPPPCNESMIGNVVVWFFGNMTHPGCGPGMVACPVHNNQIAPCGPLPPLNYNHAPRQGKTCNAYACELSMQCTALTGPTNSAFPT